MKQISDNELYLLIKYIKSVHWRVAKRLSYIEEARCLKVKPLMKMNETERPETSAYKIHTPGNHPKERIQQYTNLIQSNTK